MRTFKQSTVGSWLQLSFLSISLGMAVAGSAAHAQVDEATGLPARAVRSVDYQTIKNGKVLFVIEYYYDRINKKQLAAAAPSICERLGIALDRVYFPQEDNSPGDRFYARARIVEVRCR